MGANRIHIRSSDIFSRESKLLQGETASKTAVSPYFPKPSYPLVLKRPAPFSFIVLVALTIHSGLYGAISLTSPGRLNLPQLEVSSEPISIHSENHVLILENSSVNDGWILTGNVIEDCIEGQKLGQRIPATLLFKSIKWIRGGQGSTIGISLHSNGSSIEADPGFGRGTYEILFEIQLDVPAYPRADSYFGVSSFSVQ